MSVYYNKAMNTNLTAIKEFGPDVKRKGRRMIKKQNRTRWECLNLKPYIFAVKIKAVFKLKFVEHFFYCLYLHNMFFSKSFYYRSIDDDSAENRTLPNFEEFLEFILDSSMEGELKKTFIKKVTLLSENKCNNLEYLHERNY